jgi:hypothetical protein
MIGSFLIYNLTIKLMFWWYINNNKSKLKEIVFKYKNVNTINMFTKYVIYNNKNVLIVTVM